MPSMPHAVQFYQDDVGLIEAVADFIKAGYECRACETDYETHFYIVMSSHRHFLLEPLGMK